MNIDWNQQAVRSAKQYLNMMGFSCKGLIKQLS
ncbi:Ltp family lipoprotein [Pseudomonas marginalis]|nr:Ltp family lipoprotein [Pseudomonas marginalis]